MLSCPYCWPKTEYRDRALVDHLLTQHPRTDPGVAALVAQLRRQLLTEPGAPLAGRRRAPPPRPPRGVPRGAVHKLRTRGVEEPVVLCDWTLHTRAERQPYQVSRWWDYVTCRECREEAPWGARFRTRRTISRPAC